MISNKNLVDPIIYLIDQRLRRLSTSTSMIPSGINQTSTTALGSCLDTLASQVELVYDKGILKQVLADNYIITLTYEKGILTKVVAECSNGYVLTTSLVYTRGILTSVLSDETTVSVPETEIKTVAL